MAIKMFSAEEELYDFLTSQPTPEQIVAMRPSQRAQERMRYLLDANEKGSLTAEETAELDSYMRLEHFVRMLKIHARQKLTTS
jgi:hypothetical protein